MKNGKSRRADFSNALVHLTRKRTEYREQKELLVTPVIDRVVPAFDVLKEMLTDGTIIGSGSNGYVKGTRTVVCFS